ncbi:hypothetical protein, partial [Bacteroides salyersiae]|uniref:hypothetical protein n=1 Tax=Bacteroides salyersiae TaxID=291644 RepID=UPI001961CA65
LYNSYTVPEFINSSEVVNTLLFPSILKIVLSHLFPKTPASRPLKKTLSYDVIKDQHELQISTALPKY